MAGNKKRLPPRVCSVCGRPCWTKTCRECFCKDRYRGKLSKLRHVLDKKDPIDRQIYQAARKKKLSFVFVGLKEDA